MARVPTIMDYWANGLQVAMVMAEAQGVIAMRLMGMAGIWSVTKTENRRMVSEKAHAMTKAVGDASVKMLQGAAPDAVAAAAIRPIRRATRANARRLTKRGFKKG
ncbi:antifreeze protein [Maribius pontilimi]|uniref:Antifreeze protein n=1 Tax=Palleronia pontilimi TaxID=1964209 RepID=A0A934II38_9RHOB|nr:antifreeze protein [Palleronia pontilimi]MBJ3763780.1 antifreeze protein [Palleronia pontilimi]